MYPDLTLFYTGRGRSGYEITLVHRNHGATAHEALSTFVEAVIFYHSQQESTSGKFVGSKERVSIGLKSSHKSLNAFRNHVTTFCGIKDECVKRVKRVKRVVSALSGKRQPSSKPAPYLRICTVHRLKTTPGAE